MKNYYFPKAKLNYKLSELALDSDFIKIGDYIYVRLLRRPNGRLVERRLLNVDTNEKITILR